MVKLKTRGRRQRRTKIYDPKLQVYDSTFKEWVQQRPEIILPQLLSGVTYVETLDVERIRPTMRVDRAYKVMYRDQLHILHLEFESGTDQDLISRLLVYHAILYRDYHLPVISIVIYPFRVAMVISPWQEKSGNETILTFDFHVLPLYSLDAERCIQEHLACMYPLLPAMQGVNRQLIDQAMEELAELYREDEVTLAQQFVWMELLLERTDTVSPEDKLEVQRSLSMYDRLWEDHPKVKQIKAKAKEDVRAEAARLRAEAERMKAEAIAEAKRLKEEAKKEKEEAKEEAERIIKEAIVEAVAEAKRVGAKEERLKFEAEQQAKLRVEQQALQTLRDTVVIITNSRFPELAELARQKAAQINDMAVLRVLIEDITTVPDESVARWVLRPSVA